MHKLLRLDGRRVFFIFPVYNETLNLPRVFQDGKTFGQWVRQLGGIAHFIFVDDGSTDETASLISAWKNPHRVLLKHSTNEGPGRAFQTAFSYLFEEGIKASDLVITLESDATSDPNVFHRLIGHICLGDDMVLASPYLYGGGFSQVVWYRVLLSNFAALTVKFLLGLKGFATHSCFYRAYTGKALTKIRNRFGEPFVQSKGFECAVELLMKAVRSELTISEVPFRVDWSRRKGPSKMRILKTAMGYLRLYWTAKTTKPKVVIPRPKSSPKFDDEKENSVSLSQ